MNEFISNREMESLLPEFITIYKKRPIKNNVGGMGFNHSFGLYVILKKLNLKNIYESGIFKGHSTWLIENTLENINDIESNESTYVIWVHDEDNLKLAKN